jgi:D-glycero-D-manno-heptose 1,7-bisphosphate phosphatase
MTEGQRRPAVFLDRDGTLVVERNYLADPARVELVPGACEALRRLREAGFALIVVTNQSGIARGLYGEADYLAVRERIREMLLACGVRIDGVYHCPHHPDFTGECECRKPGTLLFERAAREHDLDPRRSWFIGDRLKDVQPARAMGGAGLLVRTGYGRETEAAAYGFEVVEDIAAAADLIVGAASRG